MKDEFNNRLTERTIKTESSATSGTSKSSLSSNKDDEEKMTVPLISATKPEEP